MVNGAKKISVLILADGMPAGGTERQIVTLLRGLKLSCPGVSTYFGVLVKGGEREAEACRWADHVMPVSQSHQLDITLAWSLIPFVKKHKIHIIHTFGSISDISGVISSRLTGVGLINGSIRSAREKLTPRDRLSRFAMKFADRIIANSYAGLRAFGMQEFPGATVIYNGLDVDQYQTLEPYRHGSAYLCMVGNFTAKKDHKALIEAFPDILKAYPSYHLILIGRGKRENEYRNLITRMGLDDRITIVNDCDEPGPYIKGADVCILLSPDGEGLSNVIMEYCALERPVVATNRGGNIEIIEHDVSGILLSSHDPAMISNEIVKLLGNKEKMNTLATRAKQVIVERFAVDRMIQNYATLYKGL